MGSFLFIGSISSVGSRHTTNIDGSSYHCGTMSVLEGPHSAYDLGSLGSTWPGLRYRDLEVLAFWTCGDSWLSAVEHQGSGVSTYACLLLANLNHVTSFLYEDSSWEARQTCNLDRQRFEKSTSDFKVQPGFFWCVGCSSVPPVERSINT